MQNQRIQLTEWGVPPNMVSSQVNWAETQDTWVCQHWYHILEQQIPFFEAAKMTIDHSETTVRHPEVHGTKSNLSPTNQLVQEYLSVCHCYTYYVAKYVIEDGNDINLDDHL